jgi:hypothetical protein
MGKSTRSDALGVFGKPKRSESLGDGANREVWYHYEGGGDVPGELVVVVDKAGGVVLRVLLHPKNLTKEEAVKQFGNDYRVTRYNFDDCLGDGESGPLYESPDGSVVKTEYRERGIVITSNYQGGVDTIEYVAKPIGSTSSRCPGKVKKS